jgi:tripartite-type tricarboxylate transporter receptor subunit TctC
MRRRTLAAATLAALSAPGLLRAQAWPERGFRLIVPYPPGGAVDGTARLFAARLAAATGQGVVVENRAGGSGTIGGEFVRRAAPDGTTFLYSASIHVVLPMTVRNTPFDPLADFVPVARVAEGPLLIVVNSAVPGATLAEVMAWAKANEAQFNFATSSFGSAGHIVTEQLKRRFAINAPIAGYRGAAPAMNDVAAGAVQLMADPILAALPVARSGRVRAVAVTADARVPAAPDIPTVAESGVPGLTGFSWYGIWAPLGTPAPIVARLNALANEAAGSAELGERLATLGFSPVTGTPADFAAFQASEVARYGAIIREAGIQPE